MSELGSKAAERALEMAGVAAEDVDLVIFATSSADDLFGDAANVAKLVGATNAVAFDLTAACSGFLFGINTASQFLDNGASNTALVIGGDALSRWVDWNDRSTCVLFGDGAGAVVLKAAASDDEAGVLGWEMHSNGAGRKDLNLCYSGEPNELGGVATVTTGTYDTIAMNGMDVYKFATTKVPKVLKEALAQADMTADDIDWVVMHQANIRIMETVAKKLGVSMDKVIHNLDEYGNTSAGSIPLALDEAVRSGKIKKGDTLAIAGFGAGLSWGACVIRWGGEPL
jgi:3-oxoacyl-[acyl-carrier-protein] synthase-3